MSDYLAPLLHRMKTGSRHCSANEVIEDVRRNVEKLLNSRLSIPGEYILRPTEERAQELLDDSLVNFGVTDFQSLNMGDPEMEKRFCDSVKAAILRYEPRLTAVAVEMVNSSSMRVINVQVKGRLIVQPFEDVDFESGLDLNSQKFVVK